MLQKELEMSIVVVNAPRLQQFLVGKVRPSLDFNRKEKCIIAMGP